MTSCMIARRSTRLGKHTIDLVDRIDQLRGLSPPRLPQVNYRISILYCRQDVNAENQRIGGLCRFSRCIQFSWQALTVAPILRSKGIPEMILELLEDLYSNTFSCVRVDGELFPWFEISSGVPVRAASLRPTSSWSQWLDHDPHQSQRLSRPHSGSWDFYRPRLCWWRFIRPTSQHVVLALEILQEESSQLGLEINWSKTKLQAFDDSISPPPKVSVHQWRI